MLTFVAMIICIRICEAIVVEEVTLWEIRQHLNSLGVDAEGAAGIGELPFLVVILDERVVMCNGVIVAYNSVITSSLCMEPDVYVSKAENVTKIGVLVGTYDTNIGVNNSGIWIRAKELIYDSNSSPLVLIRLNEALQMNWNVNAIRLPDKPFKETEHCFAMGFAFLNLIKPIYQYKIAVDIYDSKTCSRKFPSISSRVKEDSLCSKVNYSEVGCRIDDARIVVCNKALAGFVVENRDTNCTGEGHFIFNDVGQHVQFLKKYLIFNGDESFKNERMVGGKHSYRANKSCKIFNSLCNVLLVKVLYLLVAS